MCPPVYHHTGWCYCATHSLRSVSSPLPPHQPLATTGLFTVSIVLPFPKWQRIGIIQYLAFSMSFHGLTACTYLALNDISLPGGSTVYLSIHLLRVILVASKVLAIMNKTATNINMQEVV